MLTKTAAKDILERWPAESREAAELVVKKWGEPDETTASMLIWHNKGQWKKIIAYRDAVEHNFPIPHLDSVESFVNYKVPAHKFGELAEFDGSVVAERTVGVMSARCHDEEANSLALNLADDVINGKKSVEEARNYYAKEFLDYRKKEPTPYMQKLHFQSGRQTGDPDRRVLSDKQIQEALETAESKTTKSRGGSI